MDEEKLRKLLGRYKPVDPPPGLRERALAGPVETGRTWPWAVAAAVLLAATIGLHVAASRAMDRIEGPVTIDADALAAAMGGDEAAREAVRLIAAEQAFRAQLGDDDVPAGNIEDGVDGAN